MLLAIDIGNTNVTLGVFEGDDLRATWRIASDVAKLTDEYAVLIESLLQLKSIERRQVGSAVLASAFALIRKHTSPLHRETPTLLACFIFLLSFISHDTHQWGMQSHLHFSLLFLVLGILASFRNETSLASACALRVV